MRVAIAGSGDMARYFAEELLAASHQVVILTRREKPWFNHLSLDVRRSDFSVSSLTEAISDCKGLISAVSDYTMASATVHLAMIDACRASPGCKSFIPSEYAGNTDEYPEQPTFYFANHEPVRAALRAQTEIRWTLFNCGWLLDYLIPGNRRYIKDIGDFHPINFSTGTIKIPGDGKDPITFTAARDVAKGLTRLFSVDENMVWEEIMYVQGELSSWNDIASVLHQRQIDPKPTWRSRDVLKRQEEAGSEGDESVIAAQYEIWSISGAGLLPQEKLKRQAERYFGGVHFRSIAEFLKDADTGAMAP